MFHLMDILIQHGINKGISHMKAFMLSALSDLFIRVASAYVLSGVIVVSALGVSVPIR